MTVTETQSNEWPQGPPPSDVVIPPGFEEKQKERQKSRSKLMKVLLQFKSPAKQKYVDACELVMSIQTGTDKKSVRRLNYQTSTNASLACHLLNVPEEYWMRILNITSQKEETKQRIILAAHEIREAADGVDEDDK